MTWWDRIRRTGSEDWFFTHLPLTPDDPGRATPVKADSAYLSAHLVSMHVSDQRAGTRRIHASVTSRVSLQSRTGENVEFVTLVTPEAIRGARPGTLDRIVLMDKRILGPVPYRGGDVELQVGLFAIPTTDLLEPYLGLVEEITKYVGVGYLAVPRMLVATAQAALNTLLGAPDGPSLEIGLVASLSDPVPGYYCVVRASRDDPSLRHLAIAEDRRLVRPDGSAVQFPYLVVGVTAATRRDDWAGSPELQGAYEAVREAVKDGDLVRAEQALAMFGRVAVFSPDLLAEDGRRLRDLVRDQVHLVFPATATSGGARKGSLPELVDLPLFG
ncbi:hypothetical protein [Dactylosporangium sp. CA-233914]|uniref:hypothetical protein n=1 Tax=Dactylosporangium sp. CA-233914 TaxID=3239934 RepID=UPI003D93F2BC